MIISSELVGRIAIGTILAVGLSSLVVEIGATTYCLPKFPDNMNYLSSSYSFSVSTPISSSRSFSAFIFMKSDSNLYLNLFTKSGLGIRLNERQKSVFSCTHSIKYCSNVLNSILFQNDLSESAVLSGKMF